MSSLLLLQNQYLYHRIIVILLKEESSPGLVKVSTGNLQVEKLSEADRQTANLNINANNNRELALAA
jgi:hypothetical protein